MPNNYNMKPNKNAVSPPASWNAGHLHCLSSIGSVRNNYTYSTNNLLTTILTKYTY